MNSTELREISSSRLALRLNDGRPYDIYVEALRRQPALLDRAAKAPKSRRARIFADYDHCTKAVRAYYELRRSEAGA